MSLFETLTIMAPVARQVRHNAWLTATLPHMSSHIAPHVPVFLQAAAGMTQQASMGGKPVAIGRPTQRNARLAKLVSPFLLPRF